MKTPHPQERKKKREIINKEIVDAMTRYRRARTQRRAHPVEDARRESSTQCTPLFIKQEERDVRKSRTSYATIIRQEGNKEGGEIRGAQEARGECRNGVYFARESS